ncbi:IS66 family transposase zinc-finger binding domain-containing protein [Lactobacillus gallinarum]|nr:IS66 family transposase zinc-finger binding domain-containing protein [Lactobacillus gallinarum]
MFPGEDREEIITYKRKKNKVKRQAVLEAFPAEEVHHELSEADRICSDCHHSLKEIGSWTVRKELVFIPAQIKRLDHIQHAYKCEQCSLNNEADKIIKAAIPKAPLWLKFNYCS